MEKLKNVFIKKPWLFVILLSLPLVWALFVPGFYGASDDLHMGWLYEMDQAIRLDQFPPRFVPDLSYQFGYPLFNFVFPLPFYIGELFHLAGFSLVASVKAVFFLSLPLSMLAMYLLLKDYTTKLAAVAGAVLYGYTPYRSTDVYVRGAIGEALAFVFYPLIVLSILKVTEKKQKDLKKWIGIGGLSIAALVLTHNIAAYMFLPFAFLLLVKRVYMNKKALIASLMTFILGALASIYFWLPALKDSALMKYDALFSYFDHFPTIKQLITPYFGYGSSVPGPYDDMSFYLGITNMLLVAVAVFFFVKKKDKKKELVFLWAIFAIAVSIFMMNFRSSFLWASIPYLAYFQFPWRFLALFTFTAPLTLLIFEKGKVLKMISFGVIVLSVVTTASYFKPHDFLGRTDAYYVNRYIPYPVVSLEYQNLKEEYLRLPKTASMRPDKIYPKFSLEGKGDIEVTKIDRLNAEASVVALEDSVIDYYKYDFPGWRVTVDGKRVENRAGEPYGQVAFDITKGVHEISVKFEETNLNLVLDGISLLAIIYSIFLIEQIELRRKRK